MESVSASTSPRRPTVAVVGGSGYVGRAVVRALESRGAETVLVSAPRLVARVTDDSEHVSERFNAVVNTLVRQTAGCSVVINAAGIADAGCGDSEALTGANSVLPALLGTCTLRQRQRYIHISSTAVQGRAGLLDASEDTQPFSPYSASKALGERLALGANPDTILYRPPGVHSPARRATQSLARFARSRIACVASPGTGNTAQALLENVADATAFLAMTAQPVPRIVSHPSEGLTTRELLRLLGGKDPTRIPRPLAIVVAKMVALIGRASPTISAISRRVEMLWFGQDQDVSWLNSAGWTPPFNADAWAHLGERLSSRAE